MRHKLLIVAALISCGFFMVVPDLMSQSKNIDDVKKGTHKNDVIKLLGAPDQMKKGLDQEEWVYKSYNLKLVIEGEKVAEKISLPKNDVKTGDEQAVQNRETPQERVVRVTRPLEAINQEVIEAAKKGDTLVVRSLLAEGAQVDAGDEDGTTALMWAADGGHDATVQVLLASGAEINARDRSGYPVILFAAQKGRIYVVRTLLATKRVDVNAKTNSGASSLMLAALEGHLSTVQALLEAGADVNARTNQGNTALMYAVVDGHAEIVRTLLGKRPDVNAINIHGNTALRKAIEKGYTSIVQLLRAHGATR